MATTTKEETKASTANEQDNKKPKSFKQAFETFIARHPERTREIMKKRYDFELKKRDRTLDAIGRRYGLTRERIRQVIEQAVSDIDARGKKKIDQVSQFFEDYLLERGGISESKQLYEDLAPGKDCEHGPITFFLNLSEHVHVFERDPRFTSVIVHKSFDIDEYEQKVDALREFFKSVGKPVVLDELYQAIDDIREERDQQIYTRFLEISPAFRNNPFGYWGLKEWPEVNPRGVREKSYIILIEEGRPMHFRELAQKIDEYGMGSSRGTNPQTVHNELIKEGRFALVGRGVYGLREWGIQEGTVRQVIDLILREYNRPMHRDEILEELRKRKKTAKSATIMINLNTNYKRLGDGMYDFPDDVKNLKEF